MQSGFVQPRGNASVWISSHLLCSSSDMKSQWPAASPQNTCLGFCSDEIQTAPFKKIKIKMKRVTPPITHLKLLSHWRIVRIDCRGDTADETHGSGERTRASAVLTRLLSGNQNLVGLMRFCSGCLFCQLCCRSFDREAKLP